MFASNPRHISITSVLAGIILLVSVPAAQAAFVFTGQALDVSFEDFDFLDTTTDSIVAGNVDPDISYNDGTNIGGRYGQAPDPDIFGIMLDFESIDFTDTTVTFTLRGDGPAHGTSGYQTTGINGRYIISLTAADFSIGGITLDPLVDMIGVSVGSGVTFDAKNIYFDISTLGILEVTGPDVGSITMNVEFVPVPAALPLMLSGLAGLILVSRRRKIKD